MHRFLFFLLLLAGTKGWTQTSRLALCDSIFSCLASGDSTRIQSFTAPKTDAVSLYASLIQSGNQKGNFIGRLVSDSTYDAKKKEEHLRLYLYFSMARVEWDLTLVAVKSIWKLKSVRIDGVRSASDDPLLMQGAQDLPPVFLERYNQLDDEGMFQLLSAQLQQMIPFEQFQKMIATVRGRLGPVSKQKPESISTFLNLHEGGSSVVKTSVYLVGERENGLLNLQLIMDGKGTFYINSFDFLQGYTCDNAEDKRRIELLLVDFYSGYNASNAESMFRLLHPNVQQSTGIDRFKNFVKGNFDFYGEYQKHEWKSYNICRSIRPDAIDSYMLVVKTHYKNKTTDDIFLLEGTVKGFSIQYYFTSVP